MSEPTNLTEKTLSARPAYRGKLLNLDVLEVELPDGRASQREIIRHPGAVAVVPLLPDDRVVLVRQFRSAADQVTLEIPAGVLEPGEDPEQAADRELQEEIGLHAGKLERLGGVFPSPAYTSEYIHLFLATVLTEGSLPRDEEEFIVIERLPFADVLQTALAGEIADSKTITAVLLAARKLGR
ncbi:MAG: NUDIX hydrolase [Chloroflexi bacterium]|nr:NUDIX hydrolase [Chloroflexota bacterium]